MIFNWVKKRLSPRQRIAALVAAIVDELNEQFEVEIHATIRIKDRPERAEKPKLEDVAE